MQNTYTSTCLASPGPPSAAQTRPELMLRSLVILAHQRGLWHHGRDTAGQPHWLNLAVSIAHDHEALDLVRHDIGLGHYPCVALVLELAKRLKVLLQHI